MVQYRKSHCGDKTILRPSYLHNGISFTGKMSSLYWTRAQVSHGPMSYNANNLLYTGSAGNPFGYDVCMIWAKKSGINIIEAIKLLWLYKHHYFPVSVD